MILQGASLVLTLTGLILILLGRTAVRVSVVPLSVPGADAPGLGVSERSPPGSQPGSFGEDCGGYASGCRSTRASAGDADCRSFGSAPGNARMQRRQPACCRHRDGHPGGVPVAGSLPPSGVCRSCGGHRLPYQRLPHRADRVAHGKGFRRRRDRGANARSPGARGLALRGILRFGACLSLLSRKTPTNGPPDEAVAHSSFNVSNPGPRDIWLEAGVLTLLLIAGGSTLLTLDAEIRVTGGLQTLPTRIDDWTQETTAGQTSSRFPGFDDEMLGAYPTETGERKFIAADDELVRTYRSGSGAQVRLYIGDYRRQGQGKELAGEAGYALAAVSSGLTVKVHSETIELNEVVRQAASTHRGVLYWYDVNGRVLPSVRRAKGYTILDALTRRRTNAAVVAIAWEETSGSQSGVARQKAVEFAQVLLPVLRQRLPS